MDRVIALSFIERAFCESTKSNCNHMAVGAVLTKNNKILVSSFNNIPLGINQCFDNGCLRENLKIPSGTQIEKCNVVHAEQQLIINCAFSGVNPENSIVFCTHSPCSVCAKILVNAKIKAFIYSIVRNKDNAFKKYFKQTGIHYQKI